MVSAAHILYENRRLEVNLKQTKVHKCIFETAHLPHRFVLVLTFQAPIQRVRNHDYRWIKVENTAVIPEFANKILQLEDGTYVQSSTTQGIWVLHAKRPHELQWYFHPEEAEALTVYSGALNYKTRVGANSPAMTQLPDVLFSKTSALELSRTPIPFVGTVCFTDHCDYDTEENLKTQRTFLKEVGVKVTKGFFLHHFSKRESNASWQNQSEELLEWTKDGHELAYHSLSQSIKNDSESQEAYLNFKAPLPNIPVWIDHGFQPYNWSVYQNTGYTEAAWQVPMEQQAIRVFWNYMDTGRAASGIVNMLNNQQFTLASYRHSIQNQSFKKRLENVVKAIVFYADNNAVRIRKYIDALSALRLLKKTKHPKYFISFCRNAFPVIWKVLLFLLQKQKQRKSFPLANFAPVFFQHQLGNQVYTVFQSVELVDFVTGLSQENIDLLIQESGILVAHTYFSVDMPHHHGRLLEHESKIATVPGRNFQYLGQQIRDQKLWNPTLSELVNAWKKFSTVRLDIDELGVTFVSNGFDLPVRSIS
ncbi:MAG: hypothetical protein RL607_549 [Bacteroidota bacterium]